MQSLTLHFHQLITRMWKLYISIETKSKEEVPTETNWTDLLTETQTGLVYQLDVAY